MVQLSHSLPRNTAFKGTPAEKQFIFKTSVSSLLCRPIVSTSPMDSRPINSLQKTFSCKVFHLSSRPSLQVIAYTGLGLLLTHLSCILSINAEFVGCRCTGPSLVNYTTNSSTYLSNLDILLSSLSSNASSAPGGFYNATIGDGSDEVYGLFLCRGDMTPQLCQTCVETAAATIKPCCPNSITAISWYDGCMIRYTNQSIISIIEQDPVYYVYATTNVTNLAQYNQTVGNLTHSLVNEACYGSTTPKYYAAGEAYYYTGFDTVYALVQCTPDITSDECNSCLIGSINLDIPHIIYPRSGGRVLKPSCNVRFEFNSPFYTASSTSASTNSTGTQGKRKNSTVTIVILSVVNGVAIVGFIVVSILYLRFRRRKQKVKFEDEVDQNDITSYDSLLFSFDTIRAATDDFSDANKLGEGGFGVVYKGKLPGGDIVAVKRLSHKSGQGEVEFKNEVILVAKLQHRNLVRLLGFCLEGEEKLLIYEFVPNTSLDHYIFDPIKRAQLDWEERYKIIEGTARGILYLHEDSRLKIIHRDLKASNILLDEEMNPKIADFGMARLFVVDQTQANTTRVVGTYGYMAPEYIIHGHFSVKTDVFSFGVLLLEIVSGQRNNSSDESGNMDGLLSFAWRHWMEGTPLKLIDPAMRQNFSISEVIRCIHIGLLCVQENMSNRPSMASVVLMLNRYSATLQLPSSPAFVMGGEIQSRQLSMASDSRGTESDQSTSKSATKLTNKISITELSAR